MAPKSATVANLSVALLTVFGFSTDTFMRVSIPLAMRHGSCSEVVIGGLQKVVASRVALAETANGARITPATKPIWKPSSRMPPVRDADADEPKTEQRRSGWFRDGDDFDFVKVASGRQVFEFTALEIKTY